MLSWRCQRNHHSARGPLRLHCGHGQGRPSPLSARKQPSREVAPTPLSSLLSFSLPSLSLCITLHFPLLSFSTKKIQVWSGVWGAL